MKRLKDYPLEEWMEAADGCEYCGAKDRVMVTWVDETGDFGEVHVQRQHKDDCLDKEEGGDYFDMVGWEYSHKVIKIAGREWPTFKSRCNVGPCLNCWKLVVGVPLILCPGKGDVELNFCLDCAKELDILDSLSRGKVNG